MAVTIRRGRTSRAVRREEIARKLFGTAEQLLAEGAGFAEISVAQLITGAGIARSTFYVYFEDKGTLLMELAERVTQTVGEAADAWFGLPPGSTPDDVKMALKHIADAYAAHRFLMAAVVETAAYDPRVRAQFAIVMERRAEDLRVGFRGQQEAGFIPAAIDVASVAPWLTWMIERGLYELTSTGADVDDRLDGMTTVVWRTLYAPTT